MTKIRALVYLDRAGDGWVADVETTDGSGTSWVTYCPSWPEAMQAAEAMRALLARLLMDQVYAERIQRRYGPIYLTAQDVHTMEATA